MIDTFEEQKKDWRVWEEVENLKNAKLTLGSLSLSNSTPRVSYFSGGWPLLFFEKA